MSTATLTTGGRVPARGPVDPRLMALARRTPKARTALLGVVGTGLGVALLGLAQAAVLAIMIVRVIDGGAVGGAAILAVLLVIAGPGLLGWAQQTLGRRASAAVRSALRRQVVAARLARPRAPELAGGRFVALLGAGLTALDGYVGGYLPQLVLAAAVPAGTLITYAIIDPLSAVLLGVTLPLLPVFLALVGMYGKDQADRGWLARARLTHHFADLVAGLPTLQVFGRARSQLRGLAGAERAHRSGTAAAARINLLSALVAELIASLSVAVVAVGIGLRLAEGNLDLATGLFVLLAAPQAYLSVRRVGSLYHDAADGLAALDEAFALIDAGTRSSPAPAGESVISAPVGRAVIEIVGRGESLRIEPGETVALTGPSGTGKTTLLDVLAGVREVPGLEARVGGRPVGALDAEVWRAAVAVVPQDPVLVAGTIADNVRLGCPGATDAEVAAALAEAAAGLLPPGRCVRTLGAELSAGERRRVALARALLRIRCGGAWLLLLDEPSAGLDPAAEAGVLRALAGLPGITVVLVSHRPALLGLVDRIVPVAPYALAVPAPDAPAPDAPAPGATAPGAPAPGATADRAGVRAPLDPSTAHVDDAAQVDDTGLAPGTIRRGAAASATLAVLAELSAMALLTTSAWLITRAAEQPPILFLMVAIVSVRAFGLGRGVLRYADRLAGHRAGLAQQSALRLRSYAVAAERMLLGGRGRSLLATLVDDVATAADRSVRGVQPWLVGGVVAVAASLVALLLWPPAGLVLLAGSGLAVVAVPLAARAVAATAERSAGDATDALLAASHDLHDTAAELAANGRSRDAVASFGAVDAWVVRSERSAAWLPGVAVAAQAVITAAVVAAIVGLCAYAGLPGPTVTVLALLPLALVDPLAAIPPAAQRLTAAARAHAALDELATLPALRQQPDAAEPAAPCGRPGIRVHDARVGIGDVDVVVPDLAIGPGERVVLTGASGSGKTTLAATLLAMLPARAGSVEAYGRIGYLAQDAYLFDTTVAENLRIARPDATPAELAEACRQVGLHLALERMVGEHGSAISGGEARRLALARLLLTEPDVLILDEPTEHLDHPTATALLAELDRLWPAAPMLIISHRPELAVELLGAHEVTMPSGGEPEARTSDRLDHHVVAPEGPVARHHGQALDERLPDQHPVERVPVVQR